MNKQKDQLEIPDIDKTPLGLALKALADAQDVLDEAKNDYEEKKQEAGKQLAAVKRNDVRGFGLTVTIKTTPGTTKVSVKKDKY